MFTLKAMIRRDAESVIREAKDVSIDYYKLDELAARYATMHFELPRWDLSVFLNKGEATVEQIIDYMMVGNSINFSYINPNAPESMWFTKYGADRDGNDAIWTEPMGMWASIKRAVQEGIDILDGEYLSKISIDDAILIFNRDAPMPMLQERVQVFNQVGKTLVEKYDGYFHNLVYQTKMRMFNNGEGLVERLIKEFPSFNDTRAYNGRRVAFYKRAQLAAAMLHEKLLGMGEPAFLESDTKKLTVFADYELPKILHAMGVLKYSTDLERKIRSREIITVGTTQEVEIRAATIWIAEKLEEKIKSLNSSINLTALHVDYALWNSGRNHDPKIYPPHITPNTDY